MPKATNNEVNHIDPLSYAIAPAVNESPEERSNRLKAEEQAKKLSEDIDRFLKKSAIGTDATGKKSQSVKVLLLGQSESGKSTALKNFQLLYNPHSFQAERAAWRMVILFNLVQSIRVLHSIITDAIQAQQLEDADSRKSPASPIFGRPPLPDFQDLFPRPQSQHIHRKRSSGPAELTIGRLPPLADDQTDAASTHSTTTSGSSTKQQQPAARRSSFFGSKEKKEKSKEDKEGKKRTRPVTATGDPTSPMTPTAGMGAFCLPTQTFGSTRRGSTPALSQTQSASSGSTIHGHSHNRRNGSDDVNPSNASRTTVTSAGSAGSSTLNGTSAYAGSTLNGSPSPTTRRNTQLSLLIPPTSPSASARGRPQTSPARSAPPSALEPSTSTNRSLSLSAGANTSASASTSHHSKRGNFTPQHQLLLMRLKPLLTVELALLQRLSLPDELEYQSMDSSNSSVNLATPATPANAAANAVQAAKARGGPILSSTEREAARLDFNLSGMHAAAVNAAREGMIDFSAPSFASLRPSKAGGGASASASTGAGGAGAGAHKPMGKTTSFPGRPRARSSADVGAGALSDGGLAKSRPVPNATLAPVSQVQSQSQSQGQGGWTPGPTLHTSTSASSLNLGGTPPADLPVPEFFVRSSTNWKEKLKRWKNYNPGGGDARPSRSFEWNPWDEDDDPAHFIQACSQNLKTLWNDPAVREYLALNQYKLEHLPGFFLSDVDRIVSREYTPTNDDILRARLKTIGAVEHKFTIDTKGSIPRDWLVYDVGGARTQRAVWVPYFDAVDAIIFIVSLSSFDQTLSEDPTVNRMEDSLRSFRDVVSSPILKNVNIVLFLNKYDLLESKLNSGIQLVRYFKRYGDRPNTADAVTKYFRAKFSAIYEKFSPTHTRRAFTTHATSLTDPQSTRGILEAVNESIIQMHIAKSVY